MQRITRILLRILPEVALVTLAFSFIVVRLNAAVPGATPAEQCGIDPEALAAPAPPGAIELEVWAPAAHKNCWLAFGPWLAAQQVTDYRIHVVPNPVNTLYAEYVKILEEALAAKTVPDIFYLSVERLGLFARRGDLAPLDECRARYPIFDTVHEELWQPATVDGQLWGVPIAFSLAHLYFSKDRLAALGWSEAQIASLPTRIADGDFTLQDLVTTAGQAVREGVVAPGYGFWPSLQRRETLLLSYYANGGRFTSGDDNNLTIARSPLVQAYRFHHDLRAARLMPGEFTTQTDLGSFPTGAILTDAVGNGSVLFWQEATYRWRSYEEIGGMLDARSSVRDRIGVAPFPSLHRGRPGHTLATSYTYYVLPGPSLATPQNHDAACALLAQTVTPEINARNALAQTMLGAPKSQATDPSFASDPFIVDIAAMWPQAVHLPLGDADFRITYQRTLVDWLLRAETGEYTAEEAATLAIQELQSKLGAKLVVEE